MLRVGIIGMGCMGRIHYEALRHVPDAQVVAVTDVRLEEVRNVYPELPIFPDYRDLFRDARPDAVVVAVPTFLHEACAVEAAKAGCAILCEKPFALDVASAQRMLEAAEGYGVILMVGQVLRFWPQYRRIKELVDKGALGSVQSITAHRLSRLPPWSSWFADPLKSGGCLFDLQVHDVDFVHWILGHPEQVRTTGIRSQAGSWDHVWTSLTYGDRVAHVEASYLMPASWPFSSGIRVRGSKGCVEYSFGVRGNIEEREQAQHRFAFYGEDGSVSIPEVPPGDAYVNELQYFFECVRSHQKPELCPAKESVQVIQVIAASWRSAESRDAVQLPSDYC
ncbi:MAG: Gfo/Idh/MocA family oxidoreductase [Terriglobia bacterium]